MSTVPYFLRNPALDDAPPPMGPQTPMPMAPVNPTHAMTAPLGPTHDAAQGMMQAASGMIAPATEGAAAPPQKAAPKPMAAKQSPLQDQEDKAQTKLMGDYAKDADPWGSPDNHPGLLGKLGHVGSELFANVHHAEGKLTPREQEEQTLGKNIQGIEAEKSKEGLEGAQAGNQGAEAATKNAELPLVPTEQQARIDVQNATANSLNNPKPKTEFDLWHQQNPTGTAEDFNKLQAKPLTAEDAQARNQVWDTIADKYHLPKGQFKEGMTTAEAGALATALNNVVGRDQGAQKIVIQNQTAQNAQQKTRDARTESEYTYTRNKWDKDLQLYNAQNEKLQEASSFIGRGAMGDALGSIKSLSGLASGAGSGVRITQAELNSIAHARGYGGDFQAYLQKFDTGKPLTPQQETELKGILSDVQRIASVKMGVINKVLDDLNDAPDSATVRRIDSQARHALMGGQ